MNDCYKRQLSREVSLLKSGQSDFVVKYFDSWKESGFCYILMELCSDNLQNIIKLKSECFGRNQWEVMTAVEYYISCQLFKEVLECVQYLHSLNPQIIHRDLKPNNVLIVKEPTNGRYLKLCDFGLAKPIENKTRTHTRSLGAEQFMAPEVRELNKDKKTRYNVKADVYSLGKISEVLFDFNIKCVSFSYQA